MELVRCQHESGVWRKLQIHCVGKEQTGCQPFKMWSELIADSTHLPDAMLSPESLHEEESQVFELHALCSEHGVIASHDGALRSHGLPTMCNTGHSRSMVAQFSVVLSPASACIGDNGCEEALSKGS